MWGILFDRFGFKPLYTLLVCVELIISASIFFIGGYSSLYFIAVCITSLLLAGNIALMVPLYPKIFGTRYGPEVNGIAVALYGFSCLLGPIIAKFFIKERSDYKNLYLSGTFFALISLITVLTFDEKVFKFKHQKNEEDGKSNIEKRSTELLITEK